MEKKELLIELIEKERKQLDEVLELGLDSDEVFMQSKKIDLLIEKYYN